MTVNNVLVNAINSRQVLEIDYEPGVRLVEPHAYGTSADGNELLRVFQTAGASASGEHVNWKLLRVDRIRSLSPTGANFPGPRPGYRRGDFGHEGRDFRSTVIAPQSHGPAAKAGPLWSAQSEACLISMTLSLVRMLRIDSDFGVCV